MSLPAGDEAKLLRFSLLKPEPVEIRNPMVDGYWVLGWSFQPDELWDERDGPKLLRMIQRRAGAPSWRKLERSIHSKLSGEW